MNWPHTARNNIRESPRHIFTIFHYHSFFLIFKSSITPLIFIFITYYSFSKKKTIFKANAIYIFLWLLLLFSNNSCDFFFFFFSLILYFWKSNLYSRFFNLCFLVFVINFIPLKTQSSVPIFTWERDYCLDHSLLLWTLLFLHQVASVSSLLLFSTQLCESLCVPDGGEHLGSWLLAGSVSLLFISLFYPPSHLCFLPPSPFLCITREHLWAVQTVEHT